MADQYKSGADDNSANKEKKDTSSLQASDANFWKSNDFDADNQQQFKSSAQTPLHQSNALHMHSSSGIQIPNGQQPLPCHSSSLHEGSSHHSTSLKIEEADLVKEKLDADLHTASIPIITSPLINAGKKECLARKIPVIITEGKHEIVLVSSSEEALEKAKKQFTRKPYINVIELSPFSEACLQFPFPDKFKFDYVNVQMHHEHHDKLVCEGFDKNDVQAAKKDILKFLKENFKRKEACEGDDKMHSQVKMKKHASLHTVSMPVIASPLINSGKKMCEANKLPVTITEGNSEIVLVSSSEEALGKARDILTRKTYINRIQLSSFNEKCLQLSFADKFAFDFINVRMDNDQLILEGFDKSDVQAARKDVLKFLHENFKKQKEVALTCSGPQLAYLSHFLQSNQSSTLLKNLPAKVHFKGGKVCIIGSREEIIETSDSLIEIVPKHVSRSFEVRNPRFLKPLLEKHMLTTVDHIIEERSGRVTVYLFENNSPALDQVAEVLSSIDPGVLYFTISPKAKNVIKSILSDLGQQQRCHIDLMKPNTPQVAIHGLTQNERDQAKGAIKDYIDENYIIVKELPTPPITGLQMKYILLKHGRELKELSKDVRSCLFPFHLTRKSAFDFSLDPDANFKVVGTRNAILFLENGLDVFTNGFFVEKFDVPFQNIHRFPWRKRWEALKQEVEDAHTSILEFKIPRYENSNSPVQFAIYGRQSEDVAQLKKTIESEVADGVAEDKLKLNGNSIKRLQAAIKDKQLNFDDYLVEVKCVEKDQVVFIKSLAITADTIEVVKTEIIGFIQCSSDSSESILFPDLAVYMVFNSKKFTFYKNAFSIAQKVNVSIRTFRKGTKGGICLKGGKIFVSAVKDQISMMINEVQQMMGTTEMTIDPLLQCALTPTFRSSLQKKLLNDFNVEFQCSFQEFSSTNTAPKHSGDEQVKMSLYGIKNNLQHAEQMVLQQLSCLLKEERMNLQSKPDPHFNSKVQQVTQKYEVAYEMQEHDQGRKVLVIKGVKTDMAVKELQQYIIEQQNTSEDDVPPEWQPQSGTTELFKISKGSLEWERVESSFSKTMSRYPIKEIWRIQNMYLWAKWIEEKNRIGRFKGCTNEKELFHGTRHNDPKLIYDSEIGFDMRFCSSGMWGQANYFAVNASYSHGYSHTNASGQREMFLVKVITGNSHRCESDGSLRMPPLISSSGTGQLDLSQVRYDTVTGTTGGSQVYMTYDNQKAYPAYLIRYC